MLSQDEIDALLAKEEAVSEGIEHYLTGMEQDALGEIGNISFGSASTALSALLHQKVQITTPMVSIIEKKNLEEEFPTPHVAVKVEYVEGVEGTNLLVIETKDAQIIADLMLGGDGRNPAETFGELQLSAVGEAMNQMMGSASTSLSTIFQKKVDISPPTIENLNANIPFPVDEDILIKVSFRLKIGSLVDSSIMQLIKVDFAQLLVKGLLQRQESAATVEAVMPTTHELPPKESVAVQSAVFSPFHEETVVVQEQEPSIERLLDIPLQLTVELGRTRRTIQEILEMAPGSIVELDKLAGEPVDILINQKLVAKGEVVVIDENFGVRVNEIVSRKARLMNLK
ncbi:flagellar motor switch protein [Fictibacillus macauensis ZFHKF-1]|uniref:Flagellar motor switch protein n=1 Tax=Fictibacillus macauensis ZFHKF-1 TaxID=1196324 RepID=I8AHB6_9BACL|nr:flagellar motor switch phosphatase FliY [Fictibacillus macauensis]EIT85092.1 flagellar motor switch protein [Fictibacillus macauensis ZFHKF-1]